jgi:hypothetical protein
MKPFKISAIGAAVTAALAASVPVSGQSPPASTAALTIYSNAGAGSMAPASYRYPGANALQGYAVVREERELDLVRGRNDVRFKDVAALIDPTTVVFESLTDPKGTSVLEQNFQFDLVSTEKLLQKYIDRPIAVEQVRGQATESFSGTLLSTQGGLVLKKDDGTVQILPHNAGVKLPALPGGLITRPTLAWSINARSSGKQRTRVSYQTQGITWAADYNVVFAEGKEHAKCKLDVAAWVSILNQSGATYTDTKLKLVAGDVHRALPASVGMAAKASRLAAREEVRDGFAEKAFFEYHLYTLGRTTTVPDNSTKQIELFPVARGVSCERTLVYFGLPEGSYGFLPSPATDRNYGVQSNPKVDVYLQFKNSEDNNLGLPLPRGRVRVSKLDPADNTLEFIGEDAIDHTPRNEKVQLKLGSAFDVVGERRQTDFKIDTARRTMTETIEVKLRNQKKERVEVLVKETLYRWVEWTITARSHAYRKEDARTVYFPVTVAPGEEETVQYTVKYSW